MRERRAEQRYMCADLVKIQVQGCDPPMEMVANLEDISPSGACLQLEAAVRKGASIEIVCSKCRLKGKVKYCRYAEMGYDVGVQFDERESWDRQRFEPQHLLDIPIVEAGLREWGSAEPGQGKGKSGTGRRTAG